MNEEIEKNKNMDNIDSLKKEFLDLINNSQVESYIETPLDRVIRELKNVQHELEIAKSDIRELQGKVYDLEHGVKNEN